MSFTEHLAELRTRLIKIVFVLSLSFMICYSFGDVISEVLLRPLIKGLGSHGKVVYLGVLDKVISQFQVGFWSSVLLSSPFWFYQLWMFIRPGLYEKEIKVVRPFILIGFILFTIGVLFGYFVIFPFTFETLMSFGVQDIEATIGLKDYLTLSIKVLLFLGLLFQLPNLILILGFIGVVTKPLLTQMRPYIYVFFAFLSAILTPPDVITLLCLWIPFVCLFEIGNVALALIVHPYQRRQHLPTKKK
jgi:sec-independent protein translocase protein TatC